MLRLDGWPSLLAAWSTSAPADPSSPPTRPGRRCPTDQRRRRAVRRSRPLRRGPRAGARPRPPGGELLVRRPVERRRGRPRGAPRRLRETLPRPGPAALRQRGQGSKYHQAPPGRRQDRRRPRERGRQALAAAGSRGSTARAKPPSAGSCALVAAAQKESNDAHTAAEAVKADLKARPPEPGDPQPRTRSPPSRRCARTRRSRRSSSSTQATSRRRATRWVSSRRWIGWSSPAGCPSTSSSTPSRTPTSSCSASPRHRSRRTRRRSSCPARGSPTSPTSPAPPATPSRDRPPPPASASPGPGAASSPASATSSSPTPPASRAPSPRSPPPASSSVSTPSGPRSPRSPVARRRWPSTRPRSARRRASPRRN